MRRLLFIIILSFVLLVSLFTQNDFLFAQSQKEDQLIQELKKFSLPEGPITENDMPNIETVIQKVIDKISEHLNNVFIRPVTPQTGRPKTPVKSVDSFNTSSDQEPLISGLLIFQNWLNQQKCVRHVSLPLAEASGKYAAKILTSYPGQIKINIIFKSKKDKVKEYNLLMLVNTPASFKFVDLNENKK